MRKEVFIDLIKEAQKVSSMYTLRKIVNEKCGELDIRGVAHKGYFAPITDFQSYYDANMSLVDLKVAKDLFRDEWPIYTRTNDSCPTQYFDTSDVKASFIANGCLVEGTVENSIIGRDCVVKPGAVVKNSIVLSDTIIGNDVHIENVVVDKFAKVTRMKEIIADPKKPGYIKRLDNV